MIPHLFSCQQDLLAWIGLLPPQPLVYLQTTKLCPLLLSFARLNKPNSLECGWEMHSRDLLNLGHRQKQLLGGPLASWNAFTVSCWKQGACLTARRVYLPPSPSLDNSSIVSCWTVPSLPMCSSCSSTRLGLGPLPTGKFCICLSV